MMMGATGLSLAADAVVYRNGRLSVSFEQTPVTHAWTEITQATGVNIDTPAGLQAPELLQLRFSDQPLERGLRRLLEGFNYLMVFEPGSGGQQVQSVRVLGRITPLATITAAQPRQPVAPIPTPEPVLLARGPNGHYVAEGQINGQTAEFLVDTGATMVALSADLARRINLSFGAPKQIETASGMTVGYETTLGRVALGELSMEQVKAVILPEMRIGGRVLLGMNFLGAFDLIQSQNVLTIQPRQDP